MLKEICEKEIPHDSTYGVEISCDPDIFVAKLIDCYIEDRDYRRKCKTKTIFFLKSEGDNRYAFFNRPYTPELAKMIREKHGDDLKEIVNERYIDKK
jgi:hypothetical protein